MKWGACFSKASDQSKTSYFHHGIIRLYIIMNMTRKMNCMDTLNQCQKQMIWWIRLWQFHCFKSPGKAVWSYSSFFLKPINWVIQIRSGSKEKSNSRGKLELLPHGVSTQICGGFTSNSHQTAWLRIYKDHYV